MHYPLVPQRIPPVIPTLRLVVLLQDPMQRAISQYFHSCQLGLEPLAVEEVLAFKTDRLEDVQSVLRRGEDHFSHQQHSYVSRSCYDEQLPRWIDLFSPDQLLVLRSEDRLINAKMIWERALEFLQLAAYLLPIRCVHKLGVEKLRLFLQRFVRHCIKGLCRLSNGWRTIAA